MIVRILFHYHSRKDENKAAPLRPAAGQQSNGRAAGLEEFVNLRGLLILSSKLFTISSVQFTYLLHCFSVKFAQFITTTSSKRSVISVPSSLRSVNVHFSGNPERVTRVRRENAVSRAEKGTGSSLLSACVCEPVQVYIDQRSLIRSWNYRQERISVQKMPWGVVTACNEIYIRTRNTLSIVQ